MPIAQPNTQQVALTALRTQLQEFTKDQLIEVIIESAVAVHCLEGCTLEYYTEQLDCGTNEDVQAIIELVTIALENH